MSTGILIFLGIFLFGALAIIGYFITIYNGLISLKENIKKSWSNIDVILKQRHDELPKLISVCESYTEFEKGILDRLMKAREKYFKASGVAKKSEASNEVTAALQGIFALAENYPDLKANKNFMQLQERISHLEETLADRREFYNDSVNNYNIRIKQIPDVLVAGMLSYQDEEMFKVSQKEREDVKINIKIPKFG
ncbi:MAG: LemA family protein [Nitrospinota bacterium]|nr:LemA family protein [Nitrospinota bacterium]